MCAFPPTSPKRILRLRRRPLLNPVPKLPHALLLSAMVAAKKGAIFFKAVSDYADAAMRACRGECVYRTLETVKRMRLTVHGNLKGLVVVVTACLTSWHRTSSRSFCAIGRAALCWPL